MFACTAQSVVSVLLHATMVLRGKGGQASADPFRAGWSLTLHVFSKLWRRQSSIWNERFHESHHDHQEIVRETTERWNWIPIDCEELVRSSRGRSQRAASRPSTRAQPNAHSNSIDADKPDTSLEGVTRDVVVFRIIIVVALLLPFFFVFVIAAGT